MNKANNVIDFKGRLSGKDNRSSKLTRGTAAVVDMTEKRNATIVHERRKVKRTLLSEFIGAFVVIPQRGLFKVAIHDISDQGMAFDIDMAAGRMNIGEEVAMRVYLNQHTYFPFVLQVANVREVLEDGAFRHGGSFVKGTVNDVALHHFVKFIENISASLATDHGDVMVSNLR